MRRTISTSRAGSTPTLILIGADALGRDLAGLALGILDRHQADRVGDRNGVADGATQKVVHRDAAGATGEVVGRDIDGGLGVGIALDGGVHALMQQAEIADWDADRGRPEVAGDHQLNRGGALAEIAPVLAAPVLERRRLAPADIACVVGHAHQRVAANALGQPGPLVLAAGRHRHHQRLDRPDRRTGYAQITTRQFS